MRTTLSIDDDVYEAVRTLADGSGKSVGKILSELARRSLRPQVQEAPSEGDLPVFPIPPHAEVIPGNRAGDLLADELDE